MTLQYRENASGLSVTMMSAYSDEAAIALLADGRILALLDKPLDGDVLQSSIEIAIDGR